MRAILRTYHGEEVLEDVVIEVSEDYDFSQSAHSEHNERCYPYGVGSNQVIVSIE